MPVELSKVVMQQFSNFFNAYAKAFNKKYSRKGALFIDYIKRREVKDDDYFSRLVYYIHNNPVHHGFCENIDDWEFSSYRSILSEKDTRLEKDLVLEWFGGKFDFIRFHDQMTWKYKPEELKELEFI